MRTYKFSKSNDIQGGKPMKKTVLAICFVVSIALFCGCIYIDGGWVQSSERFDILQDMNVFISERSNKEYKFLVFDLDEDQSLNEEYVFSAVARVNGTKREYNMDSANIFIRAELIREDGENCKVEVGYAFSGLFENDKIRDGMLFEIIPMLPEDVATTFSVFYYNPSYSNQYNYAICADGEPIAHMIISSEQKEKEELIGEICEMIKNKLTVVCLE